MRYLFFVCILILSLLGGCYYDSTESLYPSLSQCDTTNVTYSNSIVPILSNNCYSCHSNATYQSGGGVKFENYTDLKVYVDNGKLYNAVAHTGPYPMPPSSPTLDDCKLADFKKWINAGAPNN
ncbi:MAG TPA: hypothetical protein VIH57_11030 [Bacteroidales bacterium]